MKYGEVRVYTNDRPTLDQLPVIAEDVACSSRLICQNSPCVLECTTKEIPAKIDSIKLVTTYACENAVDVDECIVTIRTAAGVFDDSTDALTHVDATTTMTPQFEGQDPELIVIQPYD